MEPFDNQIQDFTNFELKFNMSTVHSIQFRLLAKSEGVHTHRMNLFSTFIPYVKIVELL